MPKKAGKGLKAHLGSKLTDGMKAHKNDEIRMGMVDIPPGIKNGIAQLTDCRFAQYKTGVNEGEYFFLAAGTVLSPKSVLTPDGTIPIEGLRTQIMRPVCNTATQAGKQTSTDEHLSWILNEMQKLGAATSEYDDDDMESIAADLKAAKPYFRFSTSQGKATPAFPDPRIFQNWNSSKGLEEYDPDEDAEPEFTEENEPVTVSAESNGDGEKAEASTEPEEIADDDLDALAADVEDNGNEASGKKLEKLASELNLDEDKVTNADTWADVVIMILEAQGAEDEGTEEATDLRALAEAADEEGAEACDGIDNICKPLGIDSTTFESWSEVVDAIEAVEVRDEPTEDDRHWVPETEEIYFFKPPRAQKSHECEVKTVNQQEKTVTLERLDDKKIFSKVPWDKLSGE